LRQLFEGTTQVQRLVITRMRARTYLERFAEAAADLAALRQQFGGHSVTAAEDSSG